MIHAQDTQKHANPQSFKGLHNNLLSGTRQVLACLAVMFLAYMPAYAKDGAANQPAQKLSKLLAKTQSLSADFTQTTQTIKKTPAIAQAGPKALAASNMNKNFSGFMAFARPSKFRWETKLPARQLIVSQGETLWIYDPDLEQATQQVVDQQMANTPALLLSGNATSIMKSFTVTQPDTDKAVFVLQPKNEEAAFERLAIAFVDNKPRSMVLHDALGQVTTIKFTNLKVNPKLGKAVFNFTPPEGVDVIYQ